MWEGSPSFEVALVADPRRRGKEEERDNKGEKVQKIVSAEGGLHYVQVPKVNTHLAL